MNSKYLLIAVAFGGCFITRASSQTWTQTSAPLTNWTCVASSADGSRVVAGVNDGGIYTSQDSGATWMQTSAPITNWSSIACSADGTKLTAAAAVFSNNRYEGDGAIYVSPNSGTNWIATSVPNTNWVALACSADANNIVAVSGGTAIYSSSGIPGPIYRSADFGKTWLPTRITNVDCTSVASSADGRKLVAVHYQAPFYLSSDAGVTWDDEFPSFAYPVSVASSADGNTLVGGTYDPFHPPGTGGSCTLFISTNSGASWGLPNTYDRGRAFVACSADGTTMIKASGANGFGIAGPIQTSTNAGATWNEHNSPGETWRSVTCSADGCKIAAVVHGGGIFTLQFAPMPVLSIHRASTSAMISWVIPSASFVLQENFNLSTTNWVDVTNTPILNFTNLRNQVTVPLLGNHFYRLKH
jgi:hypothetical protein